MKRLLIPGVLLLTASGQSNSPSPRVDLAFDRYATPARRVALPDGRRLNLDCRGRGAPTVLLFPGLKAWSETWVRVHDRLASKRRVCAFDPAGFGFSDASSEPQDATHIVIDLEAALKLIGITGPFIVVGHSAGGLQALVFADRHKRQVRGMVLVDPSYPGVAAELDRLAPNSAKSFAGLQERETAAYARCANALAARIKPSQRGAMFCFGYRPDFSEKLQAALAAAETPERMRTKIAQVEGFSVSSSETVDPGRSYGAMPLVVLTRGNMGSAQELTPQAVSEGAAGDRAWTAAHAALARLSTRGEQRTVTGASHMIQFDEPDAVVHAVEEVIGSGR